jgi:L-2-hydroxyglutarate oxidase
VIPRLRDPLERGMTNGVRDLRWLDVSALGEVEPHAQGVAAVHSRHTAIVAFVAISQQLARDVSEAGGAIRLDEQVHVVLQGAQSITRRPRAGLAGTTWLSPAPRCRQIEWPEWLGDSAAPAIIPFRGECLTLRPERTHLVRGQIYPVPDPRYPFLGVRLTLRDGPARRLVVRASQLTGEGIICAKWVLPRVNMG